MHKQQGKWFYRQPRYYNQFACIGSECSANCCYGWRINWKGDEVDKIKNAPGCSPELKEKIENSFVLDDTKGENDYRVEFDERGKCPCVTEDGLCQIQKELGAGYLSKTCMIYPRSNVFFNRDSNTVYRVLNLSCQEVVRKLINDEKATELLNVSITAKENFKLKLRFPHKADNIAVQPELKYRSLLLEFFYELIGDKKCSLETNIILGALAAQKLTQIVESKQYDMIPEALKAFRKQVHNAAALKSIEDIRPNYNISIGVVEKLIDNTSNLKITDLLKNQDGVLDAVLYAAGELRLAEHFIDRPFWLRNIALSMILELCIPINSKEHTIFENYSFFVAVFACIRLNAIAAALAPDNFNYKHRQLNFHFEGLDNKICGLTGIISRRFFQTMKTFGDVTNVLKDFGMNSPAYLALLVK